VSTRVAIYVAGLLGVTVSCVLMDVSVPDIGSRLWFLTLGYWLAALTAEKQ